MSKTKIRVANPGLYGNTATTLTQSCKVGDTTLNVASTIGFSEIVATEDRYYVVIGLYGSEKTEIVLVTAKADKTFTTEALKYSHSSSDRVTLIPYNQVKFYGMSSPTGAETLLETVDIDCTSQSTSYTYTAGVFNFFKTSYYRSAPTSSESDFSDVISGSTYSRYSVKKILESALRKAMTKADENDSGGALSWDNLIDLADEGLVEITTRKKEWSFLHKIDTSKSTTAGVDYIDEPSDASVIDFIKIKNRKIPYVSRFRYNQLMSRNLTTGDVLYWTRKNGKIYCLPTPSSDNDVIIEYFSMPDRITSLTDVVPKELATALIYYIAAQAAYTRGNEKRGDKMYVYYNQVINQQIEDVTGYEQSGTSEEIEQTSIYGDEFENQFLI